MGRIKLLALLGSLDNKEMSDFGRYLGSAHTGEKVALRTFAYLKRFHPSFDEKKLDLDKAAKLIFEETQSCRKGLLNTFHDLYGWLKAFLLMRKVADRSLESEMLWHSVLRERRMADLSKKVEEDQLYRLKAVPRTHTQSYLDAVTASHRACFGQGGVKVNNDVFVCFDQELEMFHAICRLKLDCEKLNINSQGESKKSASNRLSNDMLAEQPLWIVYDKLHSLMQNGGGEEYLRAEAALSNYAAQLDKVEAYAAFAYLKNHVTQQLREGDNEAWIKAHRLDKLAVRYKLLMGEDGLMTPTQFFNIVNAAGRVGGQEWGKSFISGHLKFLDEGVRYEVSVLAKATLHFTQGEHAQVLKKLKAFEGNRPKDLDLAMRCRSMGLISNYEVENDADLHWNDAISFETFLKRKGTPRVSAVKATLNFLRFYKKLLSQKIDKQQVTAEIKATKSLYYRAWLLEKFEQARAGH